MVSEDKTYKVVASYTIQRIIDKDGNSGLMRLCDGFQGYEVLGLLEQAAFDVKLQLTGADAIKRIVIRDKREGA